MDTNGYLGIDIGGTKIKFAKVYSDGTIDQTNKVDTPEDLAGFLDQIDRIYTSFDSNEIESVAISLPGKVNSEEGVVYFGGSLPYLHQFNFKKHFKEKYNKSCTIINDGKAGALCELWLGNLKGIKNGLVITLGTGVGGGIILDGKLHQGTNFQAGELSFITKNLFDLDRKNIVGYELSAVNFIEDCSEVLNLSKPYDGEIVFDEIKKNNAAVTALFVDYAKKIVNLIVNLQAILDVEKVLIGGGISEQPVLIDELNKQYKALRKESAIYGSIFEPLAIDTCAFKNNSNILGAVFASINLA
ncbi:ROK family protein [Alkalibacterium sp. f15]|uniref:ROK family protein n=1 Tax=Alkalibacterium sp. f15 TaxID=3414029 RepID=UPI003BF7D418